MNKSTPLSQLPSSNTQPGFVNDQQRQFITQAQQAVSNSPIPQNTQASSDIINDDDAIVQDILNQINTASNGASNTNDQEPQQQNIAYFPTAQPQPSLSPQTLLQLSQLSGLNGGMMQQAQQMPSINPMGALNSLNALNQLPPQSSLLSPILSMVTDDLKLAGMVFMIVVLVHFIPLDKFIGKYFAVDKIPYHQIILRAIMATLIIIIVQKLSKP